MERSIPGLSVLFKNRTICKKRLRSVKRLFKRDKGNILSKIEVAIDINLSTKISVRINL